ncbi:MAG TPA: 2-oxoglutarate dehydrogenase complex dihydrolipoyllysine-residue succinyltransferase [Polyangiaceae bacterium]|jgi:2-oxoglutarate dehydrogenase E2 component (dihydrolipoamide succinyltransferase)|nr:MAG: Dihydrolipoyllysine-residue succinyltransferase component of 2-oxoglutarate dehydrogenase complex [Deltaproteobacteria bacterium ADurb.Bin207]HNS97496.1 2-oxoglutarate dehydrogenase complex dihydrolipoyllysine-residue succinyltransferase [Polyangiaceae bacterium]HNZ22998.1 2-oxoglutarate dehydrogenase complex dihydrolipoyllysine-residue succinyltransferase [Polyangiaceae bacterium]HOD24372.1 2-oxoglutarate dehydrogenase complex dihydrolipoyllysine-residue succinyltransferase [Polyangiace
MTMIIQVEVPQVGESITEGVLVEWLKRDGDRVVTDDPLFTLETDKVTMTINAEHAGTLKILVPAGQTVKIGQVVAEVDTQPTEASPQAVPQTPGPAFHPIAGAPQARNKLAQTDLAELAPSVRRLVQEHELDPKAIEATGRDGRITKGDVLAHVAREPVPMQQPPQPTPPEVVTTPVQDAPPPVKRLAVLRTTEDIQSRQTRTPMSPLRQRIAERLVQAKNDTALLTTFNEADMSHVIALRARYKEAFEKKHGVALGFMSFFVKAVVDALQTVPELNAQIQGDEIVQNHFYDIGVAVGTERGLVVPVVRDCDQLSFAGVEKQIAALAKKVRDKTITLPELSGGVFTISNGGIYGSLLSTPILNPPQSGILGMHAIKKRPIAIGDEVVVRPMMYLALSYDHRLVDGREAVTFLKRIVDCIENPERLLLEI